ncbi:sensor histidine kinase [Paenibacillus sp. J5C_2022]|uniref:sensor histidine kinase n=1 Tax=Paenibacillus sp. J5C2022 TaxID=2977129 RepID=UPI0021D23937|nr:sensor histidine kinase [Paenibacillus sp. J5C2022]MCU6709155.1 sensor histidine kinase [Paenibacillus sp. J5C2022]
MMRSLFASLPLKMFGIGFISISSLILLLGLVSQQYISQQFTSQQQSYVTHALNRTDYFLNQFMKSIQKDLHFIAGDDRLRSSDPDEMMEALDRYKLQWNEDIKNLYYMDGNGHVVGTSRLLWEIAPPEQISRLYRHLNSSDSSVVWTEPYFSPVSDYTVTVVVKLPTAEDGKAAAILAADLNLDALWTSYVDHEYSSRESLLIVSRGYQPISIHSPYVGYDAFGKSYYLRGFPAVSIENNLSSWRVKDDDGRRLLITRASGNLWGWQVMIMLDESVLERSLSFMKAFSALIGLAALLLCLFVSYYLARYVTRPLKQLIGQMKKVSAGDFQTQIAVARQDELGMLGIAFNRMVVKVKQLMEANVRTEIEKKHYELKVLQTQIQPHFLYNTLNSISYLARRGETKEVDAMITNLSALLHFHLDKVQEFVPFSEELDGVNRYVFLMNIRYPGQFILDCDIGEDMTEVLIPKFTLQPVVENAIFHGILPKGELGSIVIAGERIGERIMIQVSDDGVGIPTEKRKTLLLSAPAAPMTGYYHLGLHSIHERLRLYYGDGCGLSISSPEGEGTTITIVIPAEGGPSHG